MPALATSRSAATGRQLRIFGVGLVVLLLATMATAWPTPVSARDWTPQIRTTRAAQVYWESAMRAADRDVRRYRKMAKQARKQVRTKTERKQRMFERRASARRALTTARHALHEARVSVVASTMAPPPPPDPVLAARALASASAAADVDADAGLAFLPPYVGRTEPDHVDHLRETFDPAVTVADVKKMERQVKQQKRSLQKAKRKARRAAAGLRSAKARLASAKAAGRAAVARRESSERSLGAWILQMEKYGRVRAQKKSKVRPGVNASFAWPARGRITQYYGRSHDGLDIASYRGAPIRAAAFGVVSYIGWNPWDEHGRAFMVVITHASGFETLYGHVLPRRSVRVGQEVRKGEVIGYMGSTGFSTGTHLHFELRRGRTTVNPLGYL